MIQQAASQGTWIVRVWYGLALLGGRGFQEIMTYWSPEAANLPVGRRTESYLPGSVDQCTYGLIDHVYA